MKTILSLIFLLGCATSASADWYAERYGLGAYSDHTSGRYDSYSAPSWRDNYDSHEYRRERERDDRRQQEDYNHYDNYDRGERHHRGYDRDY